jgi:hypothetical protein
MKKLSLSTETLRVLVDEELATVQGARKRPWKKTGNAGRCKARKKSNAACR